LESKQPSSNNPRLTMKILHMLIKDIEHQEHILMQRIEQLEQQLGEFYQTRDEVAATENRITRAMRHAPPRKKSFWFWK
jgi:phage shock protein A